MHGQHWGLAAANISLEDVNEHGAGCASVVGNTLEMILHDTLASTSGTRFHASEDWDEANQAHTTQVCAIPCSQLASLWPSHCS